MLAEHIIDTDILVIGGATAGLYAAIKAGQKGRRVTLVDKAYAGKSGVSPFAFAHHTVFNPKVHDFNRWMNFIVRTGEYVNNRDWIATILRDSLARYQEMVSWGVPVLPPENEVIWHKSHIPETDALGVVDHAEALVHRKWLVRMRDKALESGVKIIDRVMITELIKCDGKVVGAVGFNTRNGDFYLVKAKAVIMASGSGGFRDIGKVWYQSTADGDAMGYRAGAELRGKEFGHKQVAMLKDIPMPTAAQSYSQKKVFVNAEGEEYFNKYALGTWGTMVGALFEVHAGRGPLYFDFDRLTQEERKAAEEFITANQKENEVKRSGIYYATVTGKKEMMWDGAGSSEWGYGGLCINARCETNIHGLYAAGDSAGTNFCGSMYPGTGYGIAGASVTGNIAAENASQYVLDCGKPEISPEEISRQIEDLYTPLSRKGGFSPAYVTELVYNLMIPYFVLGIKQAERLQATSTLIDFVKDHLVPKLKASDSHDLRLAHEVRNMVLNAQIVLQASLFRTESRGTHYREDYPRRDDQNWLAWTILKEQDGKMNLRKQMIPEEWRPDPLIPYEKRYPVRFPGE